MAEYSILAVGVLIGLYIAELVSRRRLHDNMKAAEVELNKGMESLGTLHNNTVEELKELRAKLESHDGYINSLKSEPLRRKF